MSKKVEQISIFEIFKIGVGPSSSHTLGPWKAARIFVSELKDVSIDALKVHLYGSLSKTGKGHATDVAVILGLEDYDPVTIDTDKIDDYLTEINENAQLKVNGMSIVFNQASDIVFENSAHPLHPNTLIFEAYFQGKKVHEATFASVGGGFVEREGVDEEVTSEAIKFPHPIEFGRELLHYTDSLDCAISDVVLKNETTLRNEDAVKQKADEILQTMLECVFRGCTKEGLLPGGLNVSRRAKKLCLKLTDGAEYSTQDEWLEAIRSAPKSFDSVNKWVSCFAIAVNEENAALGKVVTSPTNGASGVIPAVLLYYYLFCDYKGSDSIRKFLYTAGEVGCLFKKNATISAAVGGCQAEIGVSSAMAAAGLTEVLGGTPAQALMAAEIAMEHHLGLTCDPIGGLVQIPCIERNTMGAMKAITASNLALMSDPSEAIVHIDTVIKAMWQTAQDMNHKYKETSEAGLAVNLPVYMPNC